MSEIRSLSLCFLLGWVGIACSAATTSGGDAGVSSSAGAGQTSVCVDNILCIQGTHWDAVQCKCVPDPVAATGGANGFCVDNVLCIHGDHWDPKLCKCVAD